MKTHVQCTKTENLFASNLDLILSNKRITQALIIQRIRRGWSAPLLFVNTEDLFSHIEAQIISFSSHGHIFASIIFNPFHSDGFSQTI